MKRVLLTGANGFIGRHAIDPLVARGFEVHAASYKRPEGDMDDAPVRWYDANLLERSEVEDLCRRVRATHLLHFAWYVEHGKFWSAPENDDWLRASKDLIAAFTANGGQRVVVSGTCAEYDLTVSEPLKEASSKINPLTRYAIAKDELRRHLEGAGVSWAWGRVFFLYGPHEAPNRLVSSVIRSLLREEAAACSHGNQVRDFLYVKDVAAAFAALLDSNVEGPVNIASGEAVTIKEIALAIAETVSNVQNIRFGSLPSPAGEPGHIVADVARLHDEVGWQPEYSLKEALSETVEWWKDH